MVDRTPAPDRSGPVLPLAAWELRRLARGGDLLRARLLLGGVLVLALGGIAAVFGRVSDTDQSPVGAAFARAVVLVQFVGVLVLAPGYGAAAVASEKDRRTLETLLSTPLSHRAIVVGKYIARAAFVVSLVLIGLPATAIALTLGGSDPNALLVGYAVTLATALLLTAIGVLAGCKSGDLRGAMLRAYGWSAAYVFTLGIPCFWFLSPAFLVFAPLTGSWRNPEFFTLIGGIYAVAQVCIALALVRSAVANLRREDDYRAAAELVPAKPILDEPPPPEVPPAELPAAPFFIPSAQGVQYQPGHWLDLNPLWWKERNIAGHLPAFAGPGARKAIAAAKRGAALAAGLCFAFGVAAGLSGGSDGVEGRFLLLVGGTIAGVVCLTGVGCSAANAVAGERQRRTLDALLSLPEDRRHLLAVKWGAAWSNGGAWLPFAVFALFVSLVGHGVVLLGGAIALAIAGCILVATFGVWVSVRSETPGRAIRLVLPAVLACAALPLTTWMIGDPSGWTVGNAWIGVGAGVVAGGLLVVDRLLWENAVRRLDEGVSPRKVHPTD